MSNDTTYEDAFDWDDAIGSGGLLDNYVATITDAEFGIEPDYNPETIRAMFELTIVSHDDDESELEPGDTINEAFNVGNDETWETVEGGKRVARIDEKKPKFNPNSGYGRLVNSLFPKSKNAIDGADKLIEVLRERGGATKADIWLGLTFRWKRLDFSFTDRETKEKVEYQRTYPVEFLGVDEDAGGGSGKSGSSKSSSKDTTNSGPSRDDLLALAADSDTYSKFLAEAMRKYPGVEDGEHGAEVMDEKNGIFAEARADD